MHAWKQLSSCVVTAAAHPRYLRCPQGTPARIEHPPDGPPYWLLGPCHNPLARSLTAAGGFGHQVRGRICVQRRAKRRDRHTGALGCGAGLRVRGPQHPSQAIEQLKVSRTPHAHMRAYAATHHSSNIHPPTLHPSASAHRALSTLPAWRRPPTPSRRSSRRATPPTLPARRRP